ncbi:hypothetical protein INT45_012579 [Circinella minor]|uniref:Uncharacterized protein n=1 Tax=Circinella minor TaxID=1195481 RepID=A0A8H7VHI0_9FUNG|nr:hypothetical protein INT45_012579 [Circinella minor]
MELASFSTPESPSSPSPPCYITSGRNHHASVSFVRCLHQAKAIVHDLESLRRSIVLEDPSVTPQLIESIQTYLDITYSKFVRLCKTLHIILRRMHSQYYINHERFESFKLDITTEWKRVSHIHTTMANLLQRALHRVSSTSSLTRNHHNNHDNNNG